MKIETIEILKNLYLGVISLITEKLEVKVVEQPVNHIWIIDRSGSMHGTLSKLIDDLIRQLAFIKPNDTISIGWFSSQGQYDWIVKGMSGSQANAVASILERYRHTVGMTCFSEILGDTPKLVETLKVISPVFSLMFLSDGHPVVSDYGREVRNTMDALGQLREALGSALLVGYGDYYNRDLMARMAERVGGALVHSGAIHQFSGQFRQFVEVATKSTPRAKVSLGLKPDICFAFDGGEVVALEVDEDGAVYVGNQQQVYTLSEKPLSTPIAREGRFDEVSQLAAVILLQRARTNDALACLGTVGDIHLMKKVSTAFTNEDFGAAEEAIKKAITYPRTYAFLEGRNINFLPKPDAFCLLDAFELLAEDEEAYFLPRHPAFNYKRVGRPSVYEEGYPKFEADPNTKCRLSDFVWHESKLNLSLRAKISGTVNLGDEAKEYGFAQNYPTYAYKNYTAIKDGVPNITELPVITSRQTFLTLQAEGLVDGKTWEAGEPFILKLTGIPVINQQIAQGYRSAKNLCGLVRREKELEAEIKTYKFLLDELAPPETRRSSSVLTTQQEAFLLSKGIGTNGYNPSKKVGEATDRYIAQEFQIKMKGFSSWPKIADVREKIAKQGKLTPTQQMISDALLKAHGLTAPALEITIKQAQIEFARVRGQIQRAKFAVILGREWFDEFTERNDSNPIEVDEQEYVFALRKVEVEL